MEESKDLTLYTLYRDTPTIKPASHAAIFYDGKQRHHLTYEEMNKQIQKIADLLLSHSASNELIGCLFEPNLIVPALILGILKASSAFVFMNARCPLKYLKHLVTYVPVRIILAEESLYEAMKNKLCPCWKVETVEIGHINLKVIIRNPECCAEHQKENDKRSPINFKVNKNLAYVIQTSGTTGMPKIVQVPHQSIVPNIIHLRLIYDVLPSDIIYLATPLSFDPSIIEIFLTVTSGATLIITPEYVKSIPRKLQEVLINTGITILQVTPALLLTFEHDFLRNVLLKKDSALRVLALGSEQCLSITKLGSLKSKENNTQFYNLYGLTELSSWATCEKLNFDDSGKYTKVSLGIPLLDTDIEVKDESGEIVEVGYGQLFVGGSKRFCLVNNERWEDFQDKRFMRPTGDWVTITANGDIYFEGRKDDIIKPHGKIFSLYSVDRCLESISEVSSHVVYFKKDEFILYLFIVMDAKCQKSFDEVRDFIIRSLRSSEPNITVLQVVFVPQIQLTAHAKADTAKMLDYAAEQQIRKKDQLPEVSEPDLLIGISALWKEFTGTENISDEDNFIMNGGNSISAVQFALEIEWKYSIVCLEPHITEVLVNSTFKATCDLLKETLSHMKKASSIIETTKEDNQHSLHTQLSDDEKNVHSIATENRISKHADGMCYEESSRRGNRLMCFCKKCLKSVSFQKKETSLYETISLREEYKFDMKECVDASPCLVKFLHSNSMIAYIGSYSGRFAAINVEQGTVVWEVFLPKNIESSACLSACGHFVLVGCYDHHLYCLDSQSGIIVWKIKTGGEIKSSPIVSEKNVAFVGCHDHHLYAVDVKTGTLIWKTKVGKGSIHSSPILCPNYICAATLDGVIAALNLESGAVIWKYNHGKPFFSSPLLYQSSIFIGCVDGSMLNFDLEGKLVEKFYTEGPVFSSPSSLAFNSTDDKNVQGIVFGSHDTNLYCCTPLGKLLWSFKCNAPVYGTPFPFTTKQGLSYVAVSCTTGIIYILNATDGTEVYSVNCAGEILSSPVIINDYLLIGCRDYNIHCFKVLET